MRVEPLAGSEKKVTADIKLNEYYFDLCQLWILEGANMYYSE